MSSRVWGITGLAGRVTGRAGVGVGATAVQALSVASIAESFDREVVLSPRGSIVVDVLAAFSIRWFPAYGAIYQQLSLNYR